jgi:hypothetical protein
VFNINSYLQSVKSTLGRDRVVEALLDRGFIEYCSSESRLFMPIESCSFMHISVELFSAYLELTVGKEKVVWYYADLGDWTDFEKRLRDLVEE